METDTTDLYFPHTFPFPLRVVSIDAPVESHIERGTRLLTYSFASVPRAADASPETRFGTWDSSIEGTVQTWKLKVGDVISQAKAKERPAVVVLEPCKHGMQIGGLCVVCGKDMTIVDYIGFSDTSRASIQMTHSAFGPTVSLEEAQRIERETAEQLLKSRKLSLIVDLDQTIVHATVDPTVGEWISEGEAWEERQEKKKSKPSVPNDSDNSDDSSDEDDECNPNWDALKDVKKFTLGPESFGNPSIRGPGKSKGKHKMVEQEGCMYYIKPRPGWKEFLEEAAKKYEMHVYTMGTRAYAEQVCAAIDPDGKLFGHRLLSRDESGSLTQKSLQRLFPCDTSMVVIIDDRADVWEWSPNLIKVIPYEFFVGIGDINSTFLPKLDAANLSPAASPAPKVSKETKNPPNANGKEDTSEPANANADSSSDTNVLLSKNNAELDAQLEERPLAKKEKELQEHELAAEQTPSPSDESATPTPSIDFQKEHHHRKALLKNDDTELQRIGKLLDDVHHRFYSRYDVRSPESNKRKLTPGSKSYDVTRIIPRIRSEALEGCHILFSGLIPLDTNPEMTEIWRSSTMFGAQCHMELTSEVTHVVAAKLGTVKVDMARKRGNIAIVSQAWLGDSIAQWRRLDEKPYLLEGPPLTTGPSLSPVMLDQSSDPEQDANEFDPSQIDWETIGDEVDAAMDESSDDEGSVEATQIDGSGIRSGNVSEDEWADDTSMNSNDSPRATRKRFRSMTPSEAALDEAELYRSPLAKRKKVASERSGMSRLKEGITANELGNKTDGSTPPPRNSPASVADQGEGEEEGEDDEEDEEDEEEPPFDLDDDFLARELEEEWS